MRISRISKEGMMPSYPFKCIDCGVEGLAKSTSKKRCDDCRKLVKYLPRENKIKVCPNCNCNFLATPSQKFCNQCRKQSKKTICKVCQKTYPYHNSSKVICSECLDSLLSVGKIWCIECNEISEANGSMTKKSLLCKFHLKLKRKEYRETAKKKGKQRDRGSRVYPSQSLQEKNKIADAFEAYLSYSQITEKLNVTQGRIKSAVASGFASPPLNRKKQGRYGWLTSTDIEKIMGWPDHRLKRNRKFIGMSKYGASRNNSFGPVSYIIRLEKFDEWLQKKEFWMLWELDEIKDPAWRLHCSTFRDDKEFWMSVLEAEKLIFFSKFTIFSWIRKKKLPAIYILGKWYIWSQDIKDYLYKNHGIVANLVKPK